VISQLLIGRQILGGCFGGGFFLWGFCGFLQCFGEKKGSVSVAEQKTICYLVGIPETEGGGDGENNVTKRTSTKLGRKKKGKPGGRGTN